MAQPANQEAVYRRRCTNYQEPEEPEEGEEKKEGVLEGAISYEPIGLNEEVVMFIDERRVFECYTVNELRNVFAQGRIFLPVTNRNLGNNFMQQFNAGERTFFMVRPEDGGQVIPINRDIFFELIADDPERPPFPPITRRIIDNEGDVRRDVRARIIVPNHRPIYANIQVAVQNGDIDAVRQFLARGVRDYHALTIASQNNNLEIVRLLLNAGIRNYHALNVSATNNNIEISRLLVEHGVLNYSALPIAVQHNNVDMVRLFLEHGIWSDYAFDLARHRNNIEMIQLFEEHLNEPHLEQNR